MQITCPHCQFAKELNLDKIPATAEIATCPKCYKKFRFRTIDPAVARPRAPQYWPNPPPSWQGEPIPPEDRKAARVHPPDAPDLAARQDHTDPPGHPDPTQPAPSPPPIELGDKKPEEFWDQIESMGAEQRDAYEERAASFGRRAGDIPAADTFEGPEIEVPWERLDQYGFFQGFFQTIKAAMFNPTAFFQSMPVVGGTLKPLTFCLLIAELQAISQFLMLMVGGGLGSADATGMSGLFMGVGSFFMLVFYPLMYAALLYISAGANHLFLMLFQSASRGFEGTFRAVCYGSAPMILSLLPFIGPVIGGFWGLVTTIIAYKCIHQATYPRVVAAILAPIFLFLLLAVFAVFIASKFGES